ncbi:hypothetical protein BDV33DRAFT_22433 [Aspergillus novoparasiticus]|uniref:Uncharacterized protein n=1 Tax=Aspergillus novoparasiticus TaxID=986946 RepID=A0A5N6EBG4_9EURO|nr:hypothetical protein BDV33DRAFT_22433 [Aspergillus novoparasiticus]
MTCNRPETVVSRTWVGIGALVLLGVRYDADYIARRFLFCLALPCPPVVMDREYQPRGSNAISMYNFTSHSFRQFER